MVRKMEIEITLLRALNKKGNVEWILMYGEILKDVAELIELGKISVAIGIKILTECKIEEK